MWGNVIFNTHNSTGTNIQEMFLLRSPKAEAISKDLLKRGFRFARTRDSVLVHACSRG
ncbi:hypothetical protein NC651_025975 [Populus alba x Populus x berolinensis]|nr:hypothetical protein NC651_025975 [Populus alba x Populus x berolinensis]